MAALIDARTVKSWLSEPAEIAFLDVREYGQHGEGHPFFAVSLPYSRFELGLPALVPNPTVRIVLCDAGDGVAERAARRAEAMGYGNVHILQGGAPAWKQAGYTLYAGRQRAEQDLRRACRACAGHAADHGREAAGHARGEGGHGHRRRAHLRRVPEDEHSRRRLLPERRARAAHPRHRPRSQNQDRGQLRRTHAVDHRCADADRLRHPQSRLRARERHPGLDARGTRAGERCRPALRGQEPERRCCRSQGTRAGARPGRMA